jgi:2-polyprenyl-3-methyl-5-hydroxy-6-metoxy-1,4-benzoquinol methylase
MSGDQPLVFPGWDECYQQQAVETMPWIYPKLDDDLRQTLDQLELRGGSALDLGAEPGTQAIQLAQRGFDVTAADISEAAIRLARAKAEAQGLVEETIYQGTLDLLPRALFCIMQRQG